MVTLPSEDRALAGRDIKADFNRSGPSSPSRRVSESEGRRRKSNSLLKRKVQVSVVWRRHGEKSSLLMKRRAGGWH